MSNSNPADDIIYYTPLPFVDPITLNRTARILNQTYADASDVLKRQVALTKAETILLDVLLVTSPQMQTMADVALAFEMEASTTQQVERVETYIKSVVTRLNPKLEPFNLVVQRVLEEGYIILHKQEE